MTHNTYPSKYLLGALLLGTTLLHACHTMESSPENISQLVRGNTLEVVNRFGPSLIHFYEDGQFKNMGPQNQQASEGVWRATQDSVCVTVTNVPPGKSAQEHCLKLRGHSVGSAWRGETDPRNGPIRYRLLSGHPDIRQIPML